MSKKLEQQAQLLKKVDEALETLKKAIASSVAVEAVKKSKTRGISGIRTRKNKAERYAKGQHRHAQRGLHVRLTHNSVAANWIIKTLIKHGALSRSELLTKMKRSKLARTKMGSINWCLDQMQNDMLITKEQRHGGRYSVIESNLKALKAERAS